MTRGVGQLCDSVSIHAPVRGATRRDNQAPTHAVCFNPRPREGGDDFVVRLRRSFRGVSIHAPVRGATAEPAANGSFFAMFQSTPP